MLKINFIRKLHAFKTLLLFKRVLFVLILLGHTYAQKNIVSISKTYDLDNDGLTEFITIEKQNLDDEFGTSAVYYEIDEFGTHIELWRFTTTNQIINASIGDINGDGLSEILVMYYKSFSSVIEIFNWTGFDFSPISYGTLFKSNDFNKDQIPTNFNIIDIDSDRVEEIVFAHNSPNRKISLYYISGSSNLTSIQELKSKSISDGYSKIISYPFKSNTDDFTDLIVISPEINKIRIQLYINDSGNFIESLSGLTKLPFPVLDVIESGIIDVDIDNDGKKEIIIPQKNFKSIAIKKLISSYQIIPLSSDIQKLFVFDKPLDDDDINLLLTDRSKLSTKKNKIKQIAIKRNNSKSDLITENKENVNTLKTNIDTLNQSINPINISPLNISLVDTNPSSPKKQFEQLSEINLKSIKPSSSVIDSIDTLFQKSQIKPIEEALLTSLKSDTVDIIKDSVDNSNANKIKSIELNTLGVTPFESSQSQDIIDTLFINEPFTLSVKPTKGTIISFNPENLPMGAKFEQISKTITWIPVLSQIGLQSIKYSLIVEGAAKPSIEEIPGESLTATPSSSTETFEFEFFIKER
tara:strand:+ start:29056 stop:30798 length:1743 start_codon:yes stop_codon:yes gene_type:complete